MSVHCQKLLSLAFLILWPCHIGILLDMPTIGCAKSKLWGTYDEPSEERGAHTLLKDREEIIGAVVRTRARVKPVFVSIGHRVDLKTSIDFILNTGRGYRLPEPTRWAHHVAGGKMPPGFEKKTSAKLAHQYKSSKGQRQGKD